METTVETTRATAIAGAAVLAAVLAVAGFGEAGGVGVGEGAVAAAGQSAGARGSATDAWDRVLAEHAVDGGVRYAALKRDRADLDRFLAWVARTDPASLPERERLAFLVNAYNAIAVAAVLERYPGIGSVRDLDGFFDEEEHVVGGRRMTLDEIETAARELDPRVHFAVVCASTSCPDLRGEAYRGATIDRQLREDTEGFLADRSRGLRYDPKANQLHASSIFKWYAGDFTGGSRVVAFFARGGVRDWIAEHVGDPALARTIREREPGVSYMDYDWSLNDRK